MSVIHKAYKSGEVVWIGGTNWKYRKVGDHASFNQFGKVGSLRQINVAIKECLAMMQSYDVFDFKVEEDTFEI
jgi:hypothetical protein